VSGLHDLLRRVSAAPGPDLQLDCDIECELSPTWGSAILDRAKPYTASLDAAIGLCERVLPGWWWKVGTCHVSDDACIAPDYSCPAHGERLRREVPCYAGSEFDAGFDVDRRPPGNVALALCEAILRAKIELAALTP
jgi:hypothetical protein